MAHRVEVAICPHCNRPMPPPFNIRGKVSSRIVEIVRMNPGITRERLHTLTYAEDPNGGPDSINVVSVIIANHINPKLAKKGYKIRGYNGRTGGYELVQL